MRNGFLCAVALSLVCSLAQAQQWAGPNPYGPGPVPPALYGPPGIPGPWGYGSSGGRYSSQYHPVQILPPAVPMGCMAPLPFAGPAQPVLPPPHVPSSVMAAFAVPTAGTVVVASEAHSCCPATVATSCPAPECACTAEVLEEGCPKPCSTDHVWFSGSYLVAWTKASTTVPLLTQGSVADPFPGVIGQEGTTVVIGNEPFSQGLQSGVTLDAGVWLDHGHYFSLEGSGLWLFQREQVQQRSSDGLGNPLFLRPFFDVSANAEGGELASAPGLLAGSVQVHVTEQLWGVELNTALHCHPENPCGLQLFTGIRYLQLSEGLRIDESVTAIAPGFLTLNNVPVPALTDEDDFETVNHFAGLQLGGKYHWQCGRMFMDFMGKAAVGVNQENVRISGFTSAEGQTVQGGVLALPSNIGNYTRNVFAVVPEGGITIGADLTHWLTFKAGYSILYWSNVVRPGDQVDRNVNPGQVPSSGVVGMTGGPTAPSFIFHDSSYWANLFTVGVELRY